MSNIIQPAQPDITIKTQIVITLTAEGQILLSTQGALSKTEAFGLLEVGRQSLEVWFKQQDERRVQPVSFLPPQGGLKS